MKSLLSRLWNKHKPKSNVASLRIKYFITPKRIKILRIVTLSILLIFFYLLIIKLEISGLVQIILFAILVCILIVLNRMTKKRIHNKFEDYYIRDKLLYVLRTNNLFSSETLEQKEIITSSALLSFKNSNSQIIVTAHVTGNQWSERVRNLQSQLQAVFQLDLIEQKDYAERTEYYFNKIKPSRLILSNYDDTILNDSGTIDLGYGIEYTPSKTPHILLQGGTGSGKSIFISFLILEFLKQGTTLYIADPKNSDLGSLSHYLGDDYVAHTVNNIARIVRKVVTEMNVRYEFMRENFIYGANFETHKFKPIWIIFDELGAFNASAEKNVLNEVMDGIKQIILLGRQSGIFILIASQQVRAEIISTDMRDQLSLRVALGSNSSEGYRMALGGANKDLKPIDTIGGGYLYMQGSGSESATYYETPFMSENYDFIKELQLYTKQKY